jgi:hypothetical protein
MSKRGRPSYLDKKKAARLKWSRNANAAKARKRTEREPAEQPARLVAFFPWRITVKNLLTGEKATFRPRSGRHAKAVLDVLFSEYQP